MANQGTFNSFLTMPGPHPSSSAQTWEFHKPTIRKLYVEKGHTLQNVMAIMERDHNFRASKKVYRKRLAKWGFEVKRKPSENRAMLRKLVERGAIGKQSKFTLRGTYVSVWNIVYQPKRTRKYIQKMASQESSGAATPPHLRCSTPEPDSWEAKKSAAFLIQFAKDIEAYKLRSNGVGMSTDAGQLHGNYLGESVADHGDAGDPAREKLPQKQVSSEACRAMAQSEDYSSSPLRSEDDFAEGTC